MVAVVFPENIQADHGELQLRLFFEYLPAKPYCTDTLEAGLSIVTAVKAIKRRYIQPNTPWDLRWLVYDIDRSTAIYDWDEVHAPAPNIIVINKENGHAHLLYGLEVPVYKQPEAHKAPLRYAAVVDVALTMLLRADPRYSGLICKNPLHKYWIVQVVKEDSYDLGWLAGSLDLSPYQDKRRHLPPVGLGRNCTLFDVTRRWAYLQIRKQEWRLSDFTGVVTDYADHYNQARFPVPLPQTEVKATGKSIAKWTYHHMSPQGFKAWGDARRQKSIITRQSKSQERTELIKAYKAEHPAMSNRMIAQVFDVSHFTINQVLKNNDL